MGRWSYCSPRGGEASLRGECTLSLAAENRNVRSADERRPSRARRALGHHPRRRRRLRPLTRLISGDIRPALGSPAEEAALDALYDGLPETNFSRDVLTARPSVLAVLPVLGVQWSDWGEPSRVLATLADLHARPCWREPVPVSMSGSTVEDQSASCD